MYAVLVAAVVLALAFPPQVSLAFVSLSAVSDRTSVRPGDTFAVTVTAVRDPAASDTITVLLHENGDDTSPERSVLSAVADSGPCEWSETSYGCFVEVGPEQTATMTVTFRVEECSAGGLVWVKIDAGRAYVWPPSKIDPRNFIPHFDLLIPCAALEQPYRVFTPIASRESMNSSEGIDVAGSTVKVSSSAWYSVCRMRNERILSIVGERLGGRLRMMIVSLARASKSIWRAPPASYSAVNTTPARGVGSLVSASAASRWTLARTPLVVRVSIAVLRVSP